MLVQAVESALAQTYTDYELIVVDDGSGPGTRAALEPYMSRIRYVYRENAGPSAARNTGIRESGGELLAFLDHDDLYLPEKMAVQVEFMDAHPEFPLTYHAVEYFTGKGALDYAAREGPSGDVLAALYKRIFLITLAVMCRRDCFEKAGYFDEEMRFAQDYDMWLRMALHFQFGCISRVLGRYRFHEANLSRENEIRHFLEKLDARKRVLADPAAAGRVPWKLRNREIASVTFKLARMYLAVGDVEEACRFVVRSMRHRPIEPRRWLFWLQTRLV